MKSRISAELNNLAAALGVNKSAVFYDGDFFGVAKTLAPYGKIAALYSASVFGKRGKEYSAQFKAAGIKPLNFIMPEGVTLNLENVFDVIGVPEDVRAIAAFDRTLMPIAAYLATVFGIPLMYLLNSAETENVLSPKAPFYLGGKTDFFPLSCPYHIVIGENACGGDIAEQYINVVGKLTALSDYRVKVNICGTRPDSAAYGAVKSAVLSAFADSDVKAETLLLSGLKIELANLASNGAIIYNSAEFSFKRIAGLKYPKGVNFALFKKLLGLYKLCAEEKVDPFIVPDYNNRARSLAEITQSDDGAFLKGFLRQLRYLKKRGDFSDLKAEFINELNSQQAVIAATEKKYKALGGLVAEDFSPYLAALKLCGDLPDTMNFMTLVRESGFTENI